MSNERPNPDTLLAQVAAEERNASRGRLKIFFGAAAGVGKTYAMLEEARKRAAEGVDLLIGYAEAHIRPDTEALLLGLEILPYKLVEYRGATLKEFDLDTVLKRKPALVCVDELAHTNAPGLRHAKRYQDVLELLGAGIDVYTTLNVQHLESVNDIVERTSGVKIQETLPDWVFEQADDVQLIDIPPDKLIERITEGKIYRQHEVERLTKQFFNKGNLSALRESALRRTADRVDAQMEDFRRSHAVTTSWPAADRILVCVGPSPFGVQLVRSARRMASAMKAQWIAAYVETPGSANLSAEARDRITQTLRLAERLGAQTITLSGSNAADEIIAHARLKNVARIIIGKPERPRWRELLTGSIVEKLIRQSGGIDIYVIRDESRPPTPSPAGIPTPKLDWTAYFSAVAVTAATTVLGIFLHHRLHLADTNVLMIDLLGVLFVAMRFGRGPALVASVLSVAAFDFTVVPPYFSFAVSDGQYLITFAVMLLTALTISTLTHRLRQQGETARQREQRTIALLELARDLAATLDKQRILETAINHINRMFACKAVIVLPKSDGRLGIAARSDETFIDDEKEQGVAQWVFEHDQIAGATTDTLPSAKGLYLPLRSSRGNSGVLALYSTESQILAVPDRLHLLEAFANQTALAIERASLVEEAQRAWTRVEAEFIRNTLLSGVSHDLRTPLAVITGSASTLLDANPNLADAERRDLLATIVNESEHMERFINNLLDMTRLESGTLQPKRELYPLQELVTSALQRSKPRLAEHPVTVSIRPDLPLITVDPPLFEQVLINLLDNAFAYTPPDSAIEIFADADSKQIMLTLSDHGPGLPTENPERVFQKFFRSTINANRRGLGLGLAICKSIVELHGGTITARNRVPPPGAAFTITLPNASGSATLTLKE